MDNLFLSAVVAESLPLVRGRSVTKISLAGSDIVLDFRLPDARSLIASLDQTFPALYLGNLSSLSSDSPSSNPFLLQLRKQLSGARLIGISKSPLDRLVIFEFEGYAVGGEKRRTGLALALMGRSSNAYLTDETAIVEARFFDRGLYSIGDKINVDRENGFDYKTVIEEVTDSMTEEEILEKYFNGGALSSPRLKKEYVFRCKTTTPALALSSLIEDAFEKKPKPIVYSALPLEEIGDRPIDLRTDLLLSHFELAQAEGLKRFEFDSLSEAACRYLTARERVREFLSRLTSLRRLLATEITKLEGSLTALAKDRERYQDPERLKRYGDLLLASLSTAKVSPSSARVIDYYDERQPEIEIEITEGDTLKQAASRYFSRYQKARRAMAVIEERERELQNQVAPLRLLARSLEQEPTDKNVAVITNRIEALMGRNAKKAFNRASAKRSRTRVEKRQGRWFRSSDGYEIGVGRNDKDNDYLTFRLARSSDIWLHAGDYPGSHVIVRNPGRADVPQRTILEAAQLAAFYSQAKNHPKAAVHYTQKKFVSKPPRAKAGLVRLSAFKTLFVEPAIKVELLD